MSSRPFIFATLLIAATSCGGQSLTTPEDLTIDTYAANQPFTLTLVMESCKDTCSTYETPECSVNIENGIVKLEVEVPFERTEDNCKEACIGQVLAHCEVGGLDKGTYTVEAGSFRRTIKVI